MQGARTLVLGTLLASVFSAVSVHSNLLSSLPPASVPRVSLSFKVAIIMTTSHKPEELEGLLQPEGRVLSSSALDNMQFHAWCVMIRRSLRCRLRKKQGKEINAFQSIFPGGIQVKCCKVKLAHTFGISLFLIFQYEHVGRAGNPARQSQFQSLREDLAAFGGVASCAAELDLNCHIERRAEVTAAELNIETLHSYTTPYLLFSVFLKQKHTEEYHTFLFIRSALRGGVNMSPSRRSRSTTIRRERAQILILGEVWVRRVIQMGVWVSGRVFDREMLISRSRHGDSGSRRSRPGTFEGSSTP
ncbi:putative sema domain [Triplophysa rosa]|uniref:Sema domain n=1 Tax=Triplophysa rosa TaxID=992332 RepID=A0A9W7WSU7_TRIRA|nr:putative sema domain [Triplophysa rosa]